ncbi:MAG: nuclear transport factor 2 family protein [Pseudomonadota bacterium]
MKAAAFVFTAVAFSQSALAEQSPPHDASTVASVNATCHDYIDGQLQGDPDRVARALHPDLAKRAVIGETPFERLGLRRMSKEELVDLTKRNALKTPEDEWNRVCKILDVTGNMASVRLETPWFVDYFHMGDFDGQWLIVNALWHPKKRSD